MEIENDDAALVSVIITNYNYGRYLETAIDSVLGQSYGPIEIIVVDDGSTDNSFDVLSRYGDRITVILHQQRGQPAALNAAVAVARGRYILPCDADDFFGDEKVEAVVRAFEDHPEAGWVYHELGYVDAQGKALALTEINPSDAAVVRRRRTDHQGVKRLDLRAGFAAGGNYGYTCPAMSGLCFRAVALRAILPMPEDIAVASDEYPKLAAIALYVGVHVGSELAYQRLHGANAATLSEKNAMGDALRYVRTAYHLRSRFPVTAGTADAWFGRSVGILLGRMGFNAVWAIREVRQYPLRLWNYRLWSSVLPRVIVHALRSYRHQTAR